jgi:Tfp pilus assembly protein PilX
VGLTRMVMIKRQRESGAVSLFLVVFAMLLITIVTLGFLRIMISDQQQASLSDLSQSAYDSSLAGVEDAKRALIYYQTVCSQGDQTACSAQKAIIDSSSCNEGLANVVAVTPNQEVSVQQAQSASDSDLNQAYTCVKMNLETADYLGSVQANTSKLIPLRATGSFDTVTLEWYMSTDLGSPDTALNMIPNSSSSKPLYQQTNWPINRPSLLRAELMQFGSTFTLDSFDAAASSIANSNANTLFLYPTSTSATPPVIDTASFASDVRQTPTGAPQPVRCINNLNAGGYACTVTITLPRAVGQSDNDRTAYLRLTPLYNATHFRISLGNNALFDGVQPSIDSTGRANDQYRRVESRVDLIDTSFPFPEAAVDLTGNLCKDFAVTDVESDFTTNCTP